MVSNILEKKSTQTLEITSFSASYNWHKKYVKSSGKRWKESDDAEKENDDNKGGKSTDEALGRKFDANQYNAIRCGRT